MSLGKGKRTKEWERVRAKLNAELLRRGITYCEVGYNGCARTIMLGHAHSRKRRNIVTEEQLRETVLACSMCHAILELLPEEEMGERVREIRANRE